MTSTDPVTSDDEPAAPIPYWRLSSFYFFYFAVVGTLMPFWPLYLQSLAFSLEQIGVVSAALMGTKVFAPNLIGWLSDRSGRHLPLIRWCSGLALLLATGLLWTQDYPHVLMLVLLFSFFWNSVLSQFEVVTLSHLGSQAHTYGRIRLWGSAGFIAVVALLGQFFARMGISWLPVFLLVFLAGIFLSSLSIVEIDKPAEPSHASNHFWRTLKQKDIATFYIFSFLLQVSHGAYYTFYSVHLNELGYSGLTIGLLWALGVIAEVIIFLFMHQIIARFPLRRLILLSLSLTVVRWLMIGFSADHIGWLLFAQFLHAFSFGICHAASIEYMRRRFPRKIQGRSQALYSAVSFGGGGAVGAWLSGHYWHLGAERVFIGAAIVALFAWVIVFWGARGLAFARTRQSELSRDLC